MKGTTTSGPAATSMGALNVCVYGSSSKSTRQDYLEASRELGRLLAEAGHVCINGGGKAGCMGAVNEGALGGGGRVTAVLHKMWMQSEGGTDGTLTDDDLQSMAAEGAVLDIVVADGPTLTERKELLAAGVPHSHFLSCHSFSHTNQKSPCALQTQTVSSRCRAAAEPLRRSALSLSLSLSVLCVCVCVCVCLCLCLCRV